MVEVVTLEAALAKMESDAGMTGEVKEMTAFVGQSLHDVAADDAAGQELLAEVQVLTTEFEERVANRQEELGKLATQYSALNQALVALHLD